MCRQLEIGNGFIINVVDLILQETLQKRMEAARNDYGRQAGLFELGVDLRRLKPTIFGLGRMMSSFLTIFITHP